MVKVRDGNELAELSETVTRTEENNHFRAPVHFKLKVPDSFEECRLPDRLKSRPTVAQPTVRRLENRASASEILSVVVKPSESRQGSWERQVIDPKLVVRRECRSD